MEKSMHQFTMERVARFFHEKGMEPSVFIHDGEIEIEMPEGWTEEYLSDLMSELKEYLLHEIELVGG